MPFVLLGVASGIAALAGKFFHDGMQQVRDSDPLLNRREIDQPPPANPGQFVQGISNENLAIGAGMAAVTLLAFKGK